jgi:hypothetical protein
VDLLKHLLTAPTYSLSFTFCWLHFKLPPCPFYLTAKFPTMALGRWDVTYCSIRFLSASPIHDGLSWALSRCSGLFIALTIKSFPTKSISVPSINNPVLSQTIQPLTPGVTWHWQQNWSDLEIWLHLTPIGLIYKWLWQCTCILAWIFGTLSSQNSLLSYRHRQQNHSRLTWHGPL